MRFVAVIGVVLIGVSGAVFVFNWRSEMPEVATLVPLEDMLGRPLVLYIDGPVPQSFGQTLLALDKGAGALASAANVRTVMDVDVYVMLRDSWDTLRALEGFELADLIRAQTANSTEETQLQWSDVTLNSPDGEEQQILMILGLDHALEGPDAFCFAVRLYETARFAQNGAQFASAQTKPALRLEQCKRDGWSSVADLPVAE